MPRKLEMQGRVSGKHAPANASKLIKMRGAITKQSPLNGLFRWRPDVWSCVFVPMICW